MDTEPTTSEDVVPDFGLLGPPECQAKLVSELAAARLEFGAVDKAREGQYGNQKFKYATLGVLTGATGEALAKHGIFVAQGVTATDAGKQVITTRIMGHGAQLVCHLPFDPRSEKGDGAYKGEPIKEWGKLTTYMRRYQYQTLLVLDAEPDADEAPASQPEPRREVRREPPPAQARQETLRPAQAQPAPTAQSQGVSNQAPGQPLTVLNNSKAAPAPTAPPVPEPKTVPDGDGPADADMVDQLRALYVQLGLNKITYSQLVQDVAGVPALELKNSARAAHAVMERMQNMVLDAQHKGAA